MKIIHPMTLRGLLTLMLALLAGCTPEFNGAGATTQPDAPSYSQVAQRYNRNLAGLDRLWSRAVVELQWQEEGKNRREQGEGQLMFILPDRVALSAGKLGQTQLWAGCDQSRYWLFDMQEQGVVRFGRHDKIGLKKTQALPTPVHPLELIALLGVMPLNNDPAAAESKVVWSQGSWLIQPPGTYRRLYLDPKTFLPVRIELLNSRGQPVVEGRLSAAGSVATAGKSPGNWPRIQTRLQVQLVGKPGSMVLHLSDISDGREDERIKDRAFDLERLIQALKPARIINVDNQP